MSLSVRRREFLGLLGCTAMSTSAAWAEQNPAGTRIPKIGILWAVGTTGDSPNLGPSEAAPSKSILIEAMAALGYVDGSTAQLMLRFPDAAADVPGLARELIDSGVDVIIAVSAVGAAAAKRLTSSVPIVVVYSADPVASGLVDSIAHPGGNVTGLSLMGADLITKRMALLREAVPTMSRVVFLFDPASLNVKGELAAQQEAAKGLGLQLLPKSTPTPDAIDEAFAELAGDGSEGVTVATQPIMTQQSARIAAAAVAHRAAGIGYHPGMARDGLLMSYGQDFAEYLRKAAAYVDKILKGAKPAELPIEQPTVLKLAINLKTAKALGLTIPTPLLVAADEVID